MRITLYLCTIMLCFQGCATFRLGRNASIVGKWANYEAAGDIAGEPYIAEGVGYDFRPEGVLIVTDWRDTTGIARQSKRYVQDGNYIKLTEDGYWEGPEVYIKAVIKGDTLTLSGLTPEPMVLGRTAKYHWESRVDQGIPQPTNSMCSSSAADSEH